MFPKYVFFWFCVLIIPPKTRKLEIFFWIFSYLNEYFQKKPNLLIQNIDISKKVGGGGLPPPPLKSKFLKTKKYIPEFNP